MQLISAELDRRSAELTITIDLEQPDVEPFVLTYSGERRQEGETAGQYRTRLRPWMASVGREASIAAKAQVPAAAPSVDDVLEDIAPAFD